MKNPNMQVKNHAPFQPKPLRQATLLAISSIAVALGGYWTIGVFGAFISPNALAQTKPVKPTRAAAGITLNFTAAEIEGVAKAIALATGRDIVVDPRVKGTINLSSDKPVSPAAALNQFGTLLRLQGFAMVDANGLLKVVPEADAKIQGGSVTVTGAAPPANNQVVTQIFKLNHETANNLVAVLRPLISPNNTINVNPGNNSLVITDYADNLVRIGRIISAMDTNNATEMELIPLKHVVAQDISGIVVNMVQSSAAAAAGQGQADTSFKTTVIPEPRSNVLIVRAANAARLNLVRSIVAQLDVPPSQLPTGNIHVVYLKNAEATKLAATLRAALSGGTAAVAAPAAVAGQPAAAAPAATTGGQIQADVATNSLIITASEPQYRQLRAVIDMLDQRRAQVNVESLIAEVSSDRAAELGIQWQGALGAKGNKNIGVIGSNFGTGGNNIISLAAGQGTVAPGKGFNFGLARETGGVYVLGFLARFLEQSGEGNVLSTPNILTLDNEEAKIVIGQNVPFITGQFSNAGGGTGGPTNPFQTIERKDVGLTLKVKPQISENGTVRLQIFQEVSSVDAASRSSPSGLITNKRAIESNVVVEDGDILVIGGLLQDEYSGGVEKVPVAGDLPFFGNLFKSETRNRKKTNLMVFLRPTVIRDGRGSENLSVDRYEYMRALQADAQPQPSAALPVNGAPVLPALKQAGAVPAAAPKP